MTKSSKSAMDLHFGIFYLQYSLERRVAQNIANQQHPSLVARSEKDVKSYKGAHVSEALLPAESRQAGRKHSRWHLQCRLPSTPTPLSFSGRRGVTFFCLGFGNFPNTFSIQHC